jgi:hypothetical protein
MEGGLLRFFEDDGKGAAVVEMSITLFDAGSAETDRRIVFQKNYAASEPSGKSADAMAAALSAGMREVSARLIQDIRAAVAQRLAEDMTHSLKRSQDHANISANGNTRARYVDPHF